MNEDPLFPESDLARLADGNLPPRREAELRAAAETSPALAGAISEQERTVSMLRALDTPAPDGLRARIEAMTEESAARARPRSPRWPGLRLRLALPVTAVLAAAAIVVVLLSGGPASGLTLRQTVGLTLASATQPAPRETTGSSRTLAGTSAGIPFPYWQRSVGWRALGSRMDRVSGRSIVTVFYGGPKGDRVGYAIVGGAPVPVSGGSTAVRHGVVFTVLRQGPARLVTWMRSGHTCVIAGRGVSEQTLLRLATADIPQ